MSKMNTVRIVGGEWRRRTLRFPETEGLRPTPDRVRETLFNWLWQDLDGLRCLDLFAGSGALGFEAASRGAAEVTLIERSPAVCSALEANAALLDATHRLRIIRADAVKFASAPPAEDRRFDVLFLDPPYRQGWIERLEPLLPRLVADDGVIYVEAEHSLTHLGEWRVVREGRAGQVYYHLMRKDHRNGVE